MDGINSLMHKVLYLCLGLVTITFLYDFDAFFYHKIFLEILLQLHQWFLVFWQVNLAKGVSVIHFSRISSVVPMCKFWDINGLQILFSLLLFWRWMSCCYFLLEIIYLSWQLGRGETGFISMILGSPATCHYTVVFNIKAVYGVNGYQRYKIGLQIRVQMTAREM